MTSDTHFMSLALAQAREAELAGEVPVGAVVVKDGEVIASGRNRTREWNDPTAHAEVIALRGAAQRLGNHRLDGAELFVTLEPCPMCSGAIFHSRLARVVFGAHDPKTGCVGSVIDLFGMRQLNHHTHVTGGVMRQECSALLQDFFQASRAHQAAQAQPLRQDALRTPEIAFAAYAELLQHGLFTYDREGFRVHCIDRSTAFADKTILCIHDLPYWSHQFLPLMEPLLAAGFRVVAPDLPGCGLSDKPKKKSWHSASAQAQSVLDVCNSLNVVPSHVLALGAASAVAQIVCDDVVGWDGRSVHVQVAPQPDAKQTQARPAGAVDAAVWNGRRMEFLAGLSAHTQEALAAPFPDTGFATVLDGLAHPSFSQRPPATLQVAGTQTIEMDAVLIERLIAELLRR